MSNKIETALELKGIAYDAFSAWKAYTEGGRSKLLNLPRTRQQLQHPLQVFLGRPVSVAT